MWWAMARPYWTNEMQFMNTSLYTILHNITNAIRRVYTCTQVRLLNLFLSSSRLERNYIHKWTPSQTHIHRVKWNSHQGTCLDVLYTFTSVTVNWNGSKRWMACYGKGKQHLIKVGWVVRNIASRVRGFHRETLRLYIRHFCECLAECGCVLYFVARV